MSALRLTDRVRLMKALGYDDAALRVKVAALTHLVRAQWIVEAQRSLVTSERAYTGAIEGEAFEVKSRGMVGVVTLTGRFPNMIEHGAEPWDLRESLLHSAKAAASGKVHRSAAGYAWRVIPFGHSLSGSGRDTPVIGQPFNRGNFTGGRALAQHVHAQVVPLVRRLAPSLRLGPNVTLWGGRLGAGVHEAGLFLRPRHAVPLYAGAVRVQHAYGKRTQSTYSTFRVISDNPDTRRSDDGGENWHHPGLTPRHLADKVQARIPEFAVAVLGAS
jgi:hypothetical protein